MVCYQQVCVKRCYDFVYVPFDLERRLCLGFAFVNLTSGELAQRLIEAFDGFDRWPHIPKSPKVCRVALSRKQGLARNLESYRNSAMMGDTVPERFKPAVFVDGRQVAFPEPTLKLRPHQRGGEVTMTSR